MTLSPGDRLGPYEVVALLGAGGMGEVYRARDGRLKRDVALKILAAGWGHDADRLARFEREAEVLASLNHPNIAAIYGMERGSGFEALVLELVEGPTLADRLARGPLPVGEALAIGRQIADGLDAAHERGIVHRDLKPANIKVREDGTVKVLDFGLAKALEPSGGAATDLPTTTDRGMTRAGAILGTTAYMSPEQTRGLPVDKRTDVWAFACVLYEMLAARAAFAGPTVSDTISAILERNPDWSALPPATPPHVRRLLERCLEKDRRLRLRDIGDARGELQDERGTSGAGAQWHTAEPPSTIWAGRGRAFSAAATVIVLLAALALMAGSAGRGLDRLDTTSYRFVPFATEPSDETSPAWSPDGESIVYVAQVDGVGQLFTRSLDSTSPTQITRLARDCLSPFWAPDGTRIYFITSQGDSGQHLWSVGATGGDPRLAMNETVNAAALAPDGKTLAFLQGPGGRRSLWIAASLGAEPRQYTARPFPETFGLSSSLAFSPDGRELGVLIRRQEGLTYTGELWILPYPMGAPRRVLESLPDPASSRLSWAPDGRHVVWDASFPDRTGWHLYIADTRRSTIRPITSGISREASPAVSPNGGRIAFATGGSDSDLISVLLDGSGVQPLLASARSETRPTWSPTGAQLAYATDARGAPEIWLRSMAEGWARPIVRPDSEAARGLHLDRPSLSPDGQRIVYEVWGSSHAIWVASVADGRGVPLDPHSPDQHSPAWSPDGKWIAYQRLNGTEWELVKVPSGGGTPIRLAAAAPGGGDHTAWSPTGEWIAHVRNGLRLTSANGDGAEKTLAGPAPAAFGFSHDGTSLYAIRRESTGGWRLVTFAVGMGRESRSTNLELPPSATVTGFSLFPDGKSFATALVATRRDIWLLEGFRQPAGWFEF